ncbi:MAG: hypothetical protein RBG13Loki_2651 [Promethearchaeota archaeon CR_4]|nr:MAG: hypothetical protein RBG13Loki_2651 [Candidatus Lokiarchaeota archaeon CR_4]
MDDNEAIVYYIISRSPIECSILTTLARHPTPKSTLLGLDPAKRTNILYHLNKLQEWHMIEPVESGGDVFRLTQPFSDPVQRILQRFSPILADKTTGT